MQTLPFWRLAGYYFFYYGHIGVFVPFFGLYLQSLSFSAWDIGVLMSQMQLTRLFGPYFWGALVDRIGHRVLVIRLSSLVSLLVFSAFFFTRDFHTILILLAILAFFWVASMPLIETLTFDHLRENHARYSRIRLWGSIGFIVAVMSAGALLDHLPLPSLLWMIVFSLVGIVSCSLVVPDTSASHPHGDSSPIAEILRQPKVLALMVASFSMSASHGTMNIFYSIFLSDHGYSKSVVGGLWSLGVLAEIVVFFFMARLLRRFSLRRILLTSFVAAVLRFVVVGWGVNYPVVLVLAQLMHGLTFGSFHAASVSAVNRWFPGRTRSRGQALYSGLGFGGGGLVGGLVSGWAWDHFGGEIAFSLSSVFALIGLIMVACWIREKEVSERKGLRVVDD